MKKLIFLLSVILTISCGQHTNNTNSESIFSRAEFISASQTLDGYDVEITNPWKQNKLLQDLQLSTKQATSYNHSKFRNIVHIPLQKVVVMTNSHARLMVELGLEDKIVGICELQYISDSTIIKRCNDGTITDCGNGMYPNIEKIMDLKPDAIFVSPFEEAGFGQLEKLGIPLIQCADYMETSPLGRSEWIKFYGRLFGAEKASDSLYSKIESSYLNMKQMASKIREKKPRIMLDTKNGSAWYVAGGKSTIGQMISDAGGDYIFADNTKSGSVPLSFESVFEEAQDADIWLLKNSASIPLTYHLLESDYSLYSSLKPFKTKNIWVCDVNTVPYFENTSFHPEMLLKDFISIFHPGLQETDSTLFYHPLSE